MSKNNFKKEAKPKNKLSSFTAKELFWLIFGILVSVNAIIFLILGLINDYADITNSPFAVPNNSMKTILRGIDFKWFGVITFVLGTIIAAFSLSSSSRNEDREKEKEARREQRLKAMEEAQNHGVVVDFTGTTSASKEEK